MTRASLQRDGKPADSRASSPCLSTILLTLVFYTTLRGPRMSPICPPEPDLTPDEMVSRALEMVPVLRGRQEECESLGRLPDSTSAELVEAGFFRALQP